MTVQVGKLTRAELAGALWLAEIVVGGCLAFIAFTRAPQITLVTALVGGFAAVQLVAPLVWTGYLPIPALHTPQMLIRVAFLLGTAALIALHAPLLFKLSLVALVPLYVWVGYLTDFIWYETTIAP